MDMNQLLHAHQIAVIGEAAADTCDSRAVFEDKVVLLAARIRDLRIQGGADTSAATFITGDAIPACLDR
jgi:hypothetical protein